MTAEIIEGEAVEVIPERAVVVAQQPGQSLVAAPADPGEMVAVASRLASVLRDIVERQRLYAVISGKKYPQVEAWMTIARLDNVVAREPRAPIRHDDGSYEAFAELIRLSDGMVIGASSALCGTSGDSPWDKRPEPARRSMAQTRATSRAFRQQYSWVMSLAGYEPTPAEEMPHHDNAPAPSAPAVSSPAAGVAPDDAPYPVDEAGPWEGVVGAGQPPTDCNLRDTPEGPVFGFVLTDVTAHGRGIRKLQVVALDAMAGALATAFAVGRPGRATVEGQMLMVPWKKDGKAMPPYRRLVATRVLTPDWTLPGASVAPSAPQGTPRPADDDLDTLAW